MLHRVDDLRFADEMPHLAEFSTRRKDLVVLKQMISRSRLCSHGCPLEIFLFAKSVEQLRLAAQSSRRAARADLSPESPRSLSNRRAPALFGVLEIDRFSTQQMNSYWRSTARMVLRWPADNHWNDSSRKSGGASRGDQPATPVGAPSCSSDSSMSAVVPIFSQVANWERLESPMMTWNRRSGSDRRAARREC